MISQLGQKLCDNEGRWNKTGGSSDKDLPCVFASYWEVVYELTLLLHHTGRPRVFLHVPLSQYLPLGLPFCKPGHPSCRCWV